MPRYRYRCDKCTTETIIAHTFTEIVEDCTLCGETKCMQKLLSNPHYVKKNTQPANKKVGELTKEYIEQNREILNQMKTQTKEDLNEPS